VILGEALSGREILGCVMIFGAVILAQLPVQK
ncbi:MAG: EamA/RhaT family transporter, partial [Eubacterium sp.]|nr:EamA/RhaT family transporter [Eubacterium sp.]